MFIYFTSLLHRLWSHLGNKRRSQFLALLVLSMLSALTEVMSLGVLFPFLSMLVSPEKVLGIFGVREFMLFLGIQSSKNLLLVLTALLILVMLFTCLLKLLLIWASATISYAGAGDLSVEIYRRSLHQSYLVHISRNTSEIVAAIGTKVGSAMQFIHQTILMISATITLIAISISLLYISSPVVLVSGGFFGLAYFLISFISKRRLSQCGGVLNEGAPKIVKALQEGLGGFRNVLLDGSQKYYCNLYASVNNKIRKAQSNIAFIHTAPRYLMEGLGFALIALTAYWLTVVQDADQSVLPIIGVFALGAQRILPALHTIYGAWVAIISSENSVVDILGLLEQPIPNEDMIVSLHPMSFNNSIELQSVYFSYHKTGSYILKNVSLSIGKSERIGIVGSTGGGKSTLLDILMGLLEPTKGQLMIDGKLITSLNRAEWRRCVAHVPQNIFIADTTIAENIALGIPLHEINMKRVKDVARQAHISDVIEARTDGYYENIGEGGLKLSGGQRQRIAVARALYKGASILILDEATSALDQLTETEVMKSILSINKELTIIIVAHRPASVKDCNRIFQIENGAIVKVGRYQELF